MFDFIDILSPHFNSRGPEEIKGIIVHCLGYRTLEECVYSLLCCGVSAHYFVPCESAAQIQDTARKELENPTHKRAFTPKPGWDKQWRSILAQLSATLPTYPDQPPVIRLVNDQDRAWHAGLSHWRDWSSETSLNSCTIGIEFHCPGYAEAQEQVTTSKKESEADLYDFYHFEPYCELLQKTGVSLIKWLSQQYQIPRQNVLAHSTIAWDRKGTPKTDPGPLFFWEELAKQELCYLPANTGHVPQFVSLKETVQWVKSILNAVGFTKIPSTGEIDHLTRRVIDAYRMQFLPQERGLITGEGQCHPESLITPLLLSTLSTHRDNMTFDEGKSVSLHSVIKSKGDPESPN